MSDVRVSPLTKTAKSLLRRIYSGVVWISPYWLFYVNRWWRTREPATFTAKVRYKMIRDRRPILPILADKICAREYIAAKLGPEILPELYLVRDNARDIDREQLPREFVLKVSHGSGGVIIVWDGASRGENIGVPPRWRRSGYEGWTGSVVHPDCLDWAAVVRACDYWLSRRYGWGKGTAYEWAYRYLEPRVLVEELLVDEDGCLPPDYKLFVFHGRCRWIQIDESRFAGHARNLYFPDWTLVAVRYAHPNIQRSIPAPDNLNRMIEVAERLGEEHDFIRVDLYDLRTRIVVGELTHYPEGGGARFDPPSYDYSLGRWWTPPSTYD